MDSIVDRFIKKYGRLPTEVDPDYLEMLRMSKYRVLAVPDVSPAKCANCGSCKEDGRLYVDFGLIVDWFGVVFVCSECLRDVAVHMGMFTPYEHRIEQLNKTIASRELLIGQGEAIKDTVLHTFEEVKEYFDDLYSTIDDHSPDTNSDSGVDKKPSESVVSATKPRPAPPKSGTTKPPTISRSKDVPSLADLLKTNP